MHVTRTRGATERASSIRPSSLDPLTGEYDDRYNALLSADARQAIRHLGARMRTTVWAFTRGLSRWEQYRAVDAFGEARARLDAAGSVAIHQFNDWKPGLADAKRYTMRHVAKRDQGRCSDLAEILGTGAERMAGLAIEVGILDAPGIPLPTNHRIAQSLRHLITEVRDRVRRIERLCDGSGEEPERIITWEDVIGEPKRRKRAGKRQSRSHAPLRP